MSNSADLAAALENTGHDVLSVAELRFLTDAADMLRSQTAEIEFLRAIRPRAFILSRGQEWVRLFREVHGYLRACHGKHGTDFPGREHAMKALETARAELEQACIQKERG